jgi:hypothetical protein
MTPGAIAFYRKCLFPVVAGAAGFSLLHLLHGDRFVLPLAQKKFIMAIGAS